MDHQQLQLRPGGTCDWGRPAEQPGPGDDGPCSVLQDGAVVLDDSEWEQAFMPCRDDGPVDTNGHRHCGGSVAWVRPDH
jgi:hypothetical protein